MGLCSSDKAKIEAQEEEICDLKLAILNAALEVAKRDKAIEGKGKNVGFLLELVVQYSTVVCPLSFQNCKDKGQTTVVCG